MKFLDLYLLVVIAAAVLVGLVAYVDDKADRQTKSLPVFAFFLAWSPVFGTFAFVEKMMGMPFEQAITASMTFGYRIVVVPIVLIPIIGVFWLMKMAIDAVTEPRPVR